MNSQVQAARSGRWRAILGGLAVAVLVAAAGPAVAQAWPSHPIQLVNPYPAGSTTDLLARALAPGLAARLGQPVVVVNRDGAAGSVGIASVARAAPDGYTLAFSATTPLIVNPMMRADTGYRREALEGICQTYDHAFAIVVAPASPLRSLADLVAGARGGKTLQYGHLGTGSIQHLAGSALAQAAGVELEPVVYRGDGPVLLDVQAGRVDFGIVVAAFAVGQPVRALALFAGERSSAFPDTPTVKEAGYDVSAGSYGGLLAPAGLPAAIKARLEAACAGAITDESYVAMARRTLQPAQLHLGAEAFAERMRRDAADKATLLRQIGLIR
jgi:tripartite-type tricarboxylate transporter receptor subunit TctC